jgi:hypothetical protein
MPGHSGILGNEHPSFLELSPSRAISSNDQEPTWEDLVAHADREYEVNRSWSSGDDASIHGHPPLRGSEDKRRGRRLAVFGRNGIRVYTISPIPFDIEKLPGLRTPSIDSHDTESEYCSPLLPHSCRAVLKEAHQKFLSSSPQESVIGRWSGFDGPSTGRQGWSEASSTRRRSWSEMLHPQNIEDWPDYTNNPSETPSSDLQEISDGTFEIWADAKHGSPSSRNFRPALPSRALTDVTNFRRRHEQLQGHGMVEKSRIAEDMTANIDAKRVASLTGAKKLPGFNSPRSQDVAELPAIVRVPNRATAAHFAGTRATMHSHVATDTPCPPDSPTFGKTSSCSGSSSVGARIRVAHYELPLVENDGRLPDSHCSGTAAVTRATGADGKAGETPPDQDSERAAHYAFALARIEGRVSPEPSSPIRRYVDYSEFYGNDVLFEEPPPTFGQPTPLRWIHRGELLQRFHDAAEANGTDHSDLSGGSSQ